MIHASRPHSYPQSTFAIILNRKDFVVCKKIEIIGEPSSLSVEVVQASSVCCNPQVAIWFFKSTACDKVIRPALGYEWTTDPISGETAVIAGLVVAGMFSSGIANIIKR